MDIKTKNFEAAINFIGEDKLLEIINVLLTDRSPLSKFVLDNLEYMADIAMYGETYESQLIGSYFYRDLIQSLDLNLNK